MNLRYKQIDFKDGLVTANNQYFNSKNLISQGASKLINVLVNQDGSIRRRPGTIKIECEIDIQSYVFTINPLNKEYIVEINKKYIKLFSKKGILRQYKLISIWDNPKLCNIIYWENDFLVLHPNVSPKIISIDKELNININNYSFYKDISGVIQQPFAKLRSELPEVYLNIIRGQPNINLKVFTLTCTEDIFDALEQNMQIKVSGRNFNITQKFSNKKLLLLEEGNINKVLMLKTKNWYVQAFNKKFGYPTIGCFYQGRFILSGSKKFSNQMWFSDIGNITSFTDNVLNDSASIKIRLYLTSEKSAINHIVAQQELLIMTDDGIIIIKGFPITSRRYQLYKINSHVAGSVKPIQIGNSIFITGEKNKNLYSLQYDESILSYKIIEISKNISNKLNEITSIAYLQKLKTLFISSIDGIIWSLTHNYDSKISAWTQLKINNLIISQLYNISNNLYLSFYNIKSNKNNILKFDESSSLDNTIYISKESDFLLKIRRNDFENNDLVYITAKKIVKGQITEFVIGKSTIKQAYDTVFNKKKDNIFEIKLGYNFKIECHALPIASQLLVNQITVKNINSGEFSIINSDGTKQDAGNRFWLQSGNCIIFPQYSNEETFYLLTKDFLHQNKIPWKIEQIKPLPFTIYGVLCKLS